MGYFCIAVQLYATVNNVEGFSAAMEVQQWVPFAELSTIPSHSGLPSPILTLNRLMTYIYICRTALLISRRYILYIYSTNIRTEYFEHAAHSPFFFLFKMPSIS
jgi:hypothetical protein